FRSTRALPISIKKTSLVREKFLLHINIPPFFHFLREIRRMFKHRLGNSRILQLVLHCINRQQRKHIDENEQQDVNFDKAQYRSKNLAEKSEHRQKLQEIKHRGNQLQPELHYKENKRKRQ